MPEVRHQHDRPLAGKRVVITRAREQSPDLVAALERQGASVVAFPTVRIEPPADRAPLQAATARVAEYDWVVFTSVNGVSAFLASLADFGPASWRASGMPAVAAVGSATASSLRAGGIEPSLVPDQHVGAALAEALCGRGDLAGARILLPRGDRASPDLPRRLEGCGAEVEEVVAYRTVATRVGAAAVRTEIDAGRIDAVTFLSSSAVESFVASVGTEIGHAVVAVIGPVTAHAGHRQGWPVQVEAREQTVSGLVQGLVDYFG